MAYHFYMGKMLCPIAPSKLQLKIANKNKTLTLINEGEINILKQAGLTEVSFDLLLPNVKYPFATYKSGFENAKYFLDELEKMKVDNKPFQFIVTRFFPNGKMQYDTNRVTSFSKGKMLFDTNMKVSLESYEVKEDANQGFDVVVSIKLKQYKDFGTKTCNITFESTKPKVSVEETRPAPSAPANKTHTVVKGDTLWGIAKKYYGNGSKYPTIYNANSSVIEATAKKYGKASSSNGHWIYPVTVLTIPTS